jgi:hypothetical protein
MLNVKRKAKLKDAVWQGKKIETNVGALRSGDINALLPNNNRCLALHYDEDLFVRPHFAKYFVVRRR